MNSPVFLDAADSDLKALRAGLAAHPHLFTSHLPVDDERQLPAWAEAASQLACSRRPIWLSRCALRCREDLARLLPGARFVRVVAAGAAEPREVDPDCLEVPAEALASEPATILARIFEFLGEPPLQPRVLLQRCA